MPCYLFPSHIFLPIPTPTTAGRPVGRPHLGGFLHALPQGLQLGVVLLLQLLHLLVVTGNLFFQGPLQGGELPLPLPQEVLLLLFGDQQTLKVLFCL